MYYRNELKKRQKQKFSYSQFLFVYLHAELDFHRRCRMFTAFIIIIMQCKVFKRKMNEMEIVSFNVHTRAA